MRPFAGFDKKFGKKPLRYLFQSALAGIVTMAFLVFLHLLEYRGIVAALGATTFMTFTMPHRVSARPRYVIGGYVMGIAAGMLCHYLFMDPNALFASPGLFTLGALAVGLASLLMVATNTEHPPAAGLALGLVLQPWDYSAVLYVLGGVIFLSVAKYSLKRFMIDLL